MKIFSMTSEQWAAIQTRDPSCDGVFFYGLKSTGKVCRPSCPSRTPNPENVRIFHSIQDALAAGYRPCRRCRPDQMDWQGAKKELARSVQRYVEEHYADKLNSQALGQHFFVDPSYLHRAFKAVCGMTILEYQHQVRMERAKKLLGETEHSLSYIALELGYSSLSHFSRTFKKLTGVSPSAYRMDCRA